MDIVTSLWQLADSVLRLDTGRMLSFAGGPGSSQLALLVVLLAGVSEAFGNSVVLFINRVRPVRFVLTLLVSGVILAFTYLFWTVSIFLIARQVFGIPEDYALVAQVVAFGYAPRLFGLFEFVPVLGRPFAVLLDVWSLLAVYAGVSATLGLSPWQAGAAITAGAVVLLTLQRTLGRPLLMLGRWLQRRAAGVDLVLDRDGLRELIRAGKRSGNDR